MLGDSPRNVGRDADVQRVVGATHTVALVHTI